MSLELFPGPCPLPFVPKDHSQKNLALNPQIPGYPKNKDIICPKERKLRFQNVIILKEF